MLVVLGVWGGLIPFIGPYFGYAFGSHATWAFTTNRLWLDILPGAAVVLGGLMLIGSGHRLNGTMASWMAMAGGAWFAVGPAVSRLWEHGPGPIGVPLFGHTRQTFELIGYFYGLGVVIMGLAAFALGRVVTRPALLGVSDVTEQPIGMPAPGEPVTTAADPALAGPQPVARRRPITGADSQEAATSESEQVPAHH